MTHEDILKLQSVGKEAQEERKAYILHDDEKDVFAHLSSLRDARIDFVLDNGGAYFLYRLFRPNSNYLFCPFSWVRGAIHHLPIHMKSTYSKDLAIHRSRICRFPGNIHTVCLQSCIPVCRLYT